MRRTPSRFVPALAAAGLCLAMVQPAARAARPSVPEFAKKIGFDASQLAALEKGEVVTKVVKTEMVAGNDTAEVAVVGMVKVNATRQAFLDMARDVSSFRNESRRKIGLIHDPPQQADFAAVEIPQSDLSDLKSCKPGKCALKLAGPGLADLQQKVDWKSGNAAQQVNTFAGQRLFAAMTAYTQQGTAAFKGMEDKSTTIHIDEQFKALLGNAAGLIAVYPDLTAYLRDYPNAKLGGGSDVMFWALADFGLKPTVTMTHIVAYAPQGGEDAVIASKQLYASHYFNGGLGLTTYAKDPNGAYVVQVDRVRADSLGGAFGGVKRSKMGGAMEGAVKKFLEKTKTILSKPKA